MKARCLHYDDDEMKLIYTEIYDDFSGVVEEKMDDFVKDEGYSSLRDLAKDMRDAVLSSDRSSLYLNTLLAAWDFEKFVKLMKRKAARMRDETKNHEQKYNGSNDENRDDRRSLEGKHKWTERLYFLTFGSDYLTYLSEDIVNLYMFIKG